MKLILLLRFAVQSYANAKPGDYGPMDPAIRRRLDTCFAPYHDALQKYLQISFDWHTPAVV